MAMAIGQVRQLVAILFSLVLRSLWDNWLERLKRDGCNRLCC